MNQIEFNERFRARTKTLALNIIKWYTGLKSKPETVRVIGLQLIRCVTSVASNFRAACRARSQAERYAKLCIVVEESDETLFWMEILKESAMVNTAELEKLYPEALEILKVMAKSRKNQKPG